MVIFIHGLGQTAASWESVAAQLDTESTALELAPLLPSGEETYPTLYRKFSALCGKGNVLCGLSLGAVLALHYATEHTENVKALILIAPQFRMPRLLLSIQNVLFHCMPERAFSSTGFSKKTFLKLTDSMKKINLSSALAHVTCPVLILCGERDTVNIKAANELNRLLSQAKFQQIPNAGHEVNLDAPKALAAQISAFLKEIK